MLKNHISIAKRLIKLYNAVHFKSLKTQSTAFHVYNSSRTNSLYISLRIIQSSCIQLITALIKVPKPHEKKFHYHHVNKTLTFNPTPWSPSKFNETCNECVRQEHLKSTLHVYWMFIYLSKHSTCWYQIK
jgi:hypothetical protein